VVEFSFKMNQRPSYGECPALFRVPALRNAPCRCPTSLQLC
jgi:hypothetical protein